MPVSMRGKSISSSIALSIALVSTTLLIVVAVAFSMAAYASIDAKTIDELSMRAETLAAAVNASEGDATSVVEAQSEGNSPYLRATLIANDGTVVYDSHKQASTMGNHSDRPEVARALSTGEASLGRYSDTLGEEMLYCAVLLRDGEVLRLGVAQSTVWGVLAKMFPQLLVILVCAVVISAFVGRRVAKSFESRLAAIDLDHPGLRDAPEELRPLLARLEEQRARLAEEDEDRRRFTSSASHQLKSPLTIISGYAELIDGGLALPEDTPHFVKLIHDETVHMRHIVDDLLALSHLEDASASSIDLSRSVDLREVARDVAGRVGLDASKRGIDVRVDCPGGNSGDGGVLVCGNERLLSELLLNLVENAIRYNVEGGFVNISCETCEDGSVLLSVADGGVGIPSSCKERVFERFYRVDDSASRDTGGAGLGLSIVKHIAKLHGADIQVVDNVPRGSVFQVSFPAERK